MQGAFEVGACAGGRSGQCLQQMARRHADRVGRRLQRPYTIVGDLTWSNYTVTADVLFQQAGRGRADRPREHAAGPDPGRHQRLPLPGRQHRRLVDLSATTPRHVHHAGQRHASPRSALNTWHPLALSLNGATIYRGCRRHHGRHRHRHHLHQRAGRASASSATRPTSSTTSRSPRARRRPRTDRPDHLGGTRQVHGRQRRLARQRHHGRDVRLQRHRGAELDLRANGTICGSTASAWTSPAQGTANGTLVELWDCNGGANQQWTPQSNGELVSAGVRQVPRRSGLHHHQRHPAGDLGLQRRRQPAVGHPLTIRA